MKYLDMVIESIYALSDKNGSSIQSIKKYMQQNLSQHGHQPASFNSLTKKAIDQAIAIGRIEKIKKNVYRISQTEKDKRKYEEVGRERLLNNVIIYYSYYF